MFLTTVETVTSIFYGIIVFVVVGAVFLLYRINKNW